MLPVCAWKDGRHGWAKGQNPQAAATAAREWYGGHTLARQAERFRELLAGKERGAAA